MVLSPVLFGEQIPLPTCLLFNHASIYNSSLLVGCEYRYFLTMSVSNLYYECAKPVCKVLLVRHPESESNQVLHLNPHVADGELAAFKDPGVTELGKRQVESTAKHLAAFLEQDSDQGPIKVLASPQRRAYTMADAFLNMIDVPVRGCHEAEFYEYWREADLYEYRRPGKGNLTVPGEILCQDDDKELSEDTEWNSFVDRVDRWRYRSASAA